MDTADGLRELGARATVFKAPAWSPSGDRMAYAGQAPQGGNALFVADSGGENSYPVADVGERTAFLWSPIRDQIAFLDTADPFDLYYQELKVVNLESGTVRTLIHDRVLAFFWSPDGEKIAYVAFDPFFRDLSWKIVDVGQAQARTLVAFVPSPQLFSLLVYFDQYAYSNSLWSPDSRYLVFTGQVAAGRNGGTDESQIYVIDVENSSMPKVIAQGPLAFWSWN